MNRVLTAILVALVETALLLAAVAFGVYRINRCADSVGHNGKTTVRTIALQKPVYV